MSASAATPRVQPGALLAGRYRIERQAGMGGMAVVFEATDLKHGRRVAIKVLRSEIATHLTFERFRREIVVAARLSHPNIVPLYESGEHDGLLFYVMPFVTGESLRDRLEREGALPIDEALRVARDVAQALSHAHASGIVHRDLKPANIMLSGGVAVVTDFGIARVVDTLAGETLTDTGLALGTPEYMSPEQVTGGAEVTPRSDLYSLGCVLYEMLTGDRPFQGPTPLATLALHSVRPAPDVRRARRDTPPAVARAVTTALAKLPEDRFESAEAFARALGASAVGAAPWRGTRTLARRRPAIAAVALALVVAAVTGWLVLGRGRRTGAPPAGEVPVVAVLTFDHEGPPDERFLTDGLTDELSSRIADVSGIRVVSRASAMQYDLRKQSLREIVRDLKVTHVLFGSVRTDRRPDGTRLILVTPHLLNAAGSDLWTAQIPAAVAAGEVMAVQERIARNVARVLDVALSPEAQAALASLPTQDMRAYLAFLRGNLHASQYLVRAEQERAVADFQEAVRIDPRFAVAHARLANVLAQFVRIYGRTPERLALFKESVDRAMALAPELPQSRIALAMWYAHGVNDRKRAVQEFERVRASQPNNAELFVQMGRAYRGLGDYPHALASLTRAVELDPRSKTNLFETGVLLFLLRRMDEGRDMMERALAIDSDWLPARLGITQILVFDGKAGAAQQRMTEMADAPGIVQMLISDPLYRFRWEVGLPPSFDDRLARLSLAEARVDTAEFYRAKGRLYARRGDRARERAYFDSALSVLQRRRRVVRPSEFTYGDLGFAHAELGHATEARAYADSARGLEVEGEAFRGWFAAWDVARLYVRLGAHAEAVDALRRLGASHYAAFIRLDPAFAPLRGDPRFEALLRGGA